MTTPVFPTLPGIGWSVMKKPQWNTLVLPAASGIETRYSQQSYPRMVYSLRYDILRSSPSYNELQQLKSFFNTQAGRFSEFLYDDEDDDTATDYQFGVGDGTTADFQLYSADYTGGFAMPINDVNVLTNIKKNGVAQTDPTDYTISSKGLVTFTSNPGAGALLTWKGSYYYRCRFTTDDMTFEKFMDMLWSNDKVEFITVKQ